MQMCNALKLLSMEKLKKTGCLTAFGHIIKYISIYLL